MKNKVKLLTLAMSMFIVGFLSSCDKDTAITEQETDSNDYIKTDTLDEATKSDLLYMREEEKLARDVYLYAYEKYGQDIFYNISQSEQKHMDAILALINKYGLEDPAQSEQGIFKDSTLQALYYSLTAQVDSSYMDALTVGATIEDLDIKDLDESGKLTAEEDIATTYERLKCGSRNHMRAFYGQITENGGDYQPQFISQEEFDRIINGDHERCGR